MVVASETEVEETADVTRCTFCLKPTDEVETMVAGPGVYICNECVALSVELISNKPADKSKMANWRDRLSDDDLLEALPKFHAVETQVERQLASWVRQARSRGITWTRIGAALGMTRQSAWERFSGEE
jgi:hypothetical protein